MRYWRVDVPLGLLVGSAGLSLLGVLTSAVSGGWVALAMILLAYPAGRRMVSLGPALWVFAVVGFTGLALAFWRSPDPISDWSEVVFILFVASMVPWWVGRYQRLRAEHRERERVIVAEQARLRERARIAQDMHDSLGHELALIALHGGALELAVDLTEEQRRAVGALRAGAVRATARLHEIVRVLGSADAAADLQPADESIDDLVRRAAGAGLRVRLQRSGSAPAWSPMANQAAHRVVQESLTNAARHAPGAPVTITVARQHTGTRIDIVNEVPAQPGVGSGTGQGLIGLDERVRLAGGRLTAGPRPDGGWAVTAELPDDAGRAVTAELPDDAGPWQGDDGPPRLDLKVSTRLTRRRQLQTAALPLGVGIALVAALVVVQLLTVARIGIPEDRYNELRIGQPQAEIEPLLPPRNVGGSPTLIHEPPRPAGATCVYYRAGTSLIGSDVYRLCFADGVLVSKDRRERA